MAKNETREGIKRKKVLESNQFDFRKGKGTTEAIYVLTELIEENIRKTKGKIDVGFSHNIIRRRYSANGM